MKNLITKEFKIDSKIVDFCDNTIKELKYKINDIEENARYNQLKVLKAFQNNRVSDTHFNPTFGYGYDDIGRDVIDSVYADVFGAEDAMVRHNIINGTHAISLCLTGVLRPGDTLVAVTGKPYDTLEEVIGIRGEGKGSLKDYGIKYKQIDLIDGKVDYNKIMSTVDRNVKAIEIQKSKGYSFRASLTVVR